MRPTPLRARWSIVGAIVVVLGGCAASPNSVASPAVVSVMPTLVVSTAPSPTTRPTEPSPVPTIAPADLVYLALGDSNVYGSPAECGTPCVTYPHLLAKRMTEDTGKSVTLLDGSQHNGLTAPKLLQEIRTDNWADASGYPVRTGGISPRAAIAAADIITITVNEIPWYRDPDSCARRYDDTCIEKVVSPFIDHLTAILAEIQGLRIGKPTAVRVTTFYNDLLTGTGYDAAWFEDPETIAQATKTARSLLERYNAAVCRVAEAYDAACIDLYHAANGPDGEEPLPAGWFSKDFGDLNQGGHTQVAEEFAKVGFEPVLRLP